jgi:hypothetical protein
MTAINSTKTTRFVVGTTPVTVFTAGANPRSVRVFANRFIHLKMDGSADSSTGMPVAELTPTIINVPAGGTLSAVIADGEPNGHVWITE